MNKNKYLHLINYSDFSLWDVKRYYTKNENAFNNSHLLRSVLIPLNRPISKDELIKNNWNIIAKINFSGELFLREKHEINMYKGILHIVPENSIIYSKINVRHGCIYYHKKNKTPFAVSTEYPVFTINSEKSNGHYLQLILRSNYFKKIINSKTSGISKSRVKVAEFLNLHFPLPSLEEQNRLVESYNEKIKQAEALEQKAKQLENDVESYLFKALGIEKLEEKENKKGLQFVEFKNLERWDGFSNQKLGISNKYKNTTLKKIVLGKPIYGANVRGVKTVSDTRYIRITDINENGSLNNEFVSPERVEDKYLLKENDFLIARSGNTVGKTFLYKGSMARAIYAGYLIKYNLNLTKVFPEFLLVYTKSFIFKKWVEINQRVSGQPNINGQEFLHSPIILPPLEIQNQIADTIENMKAEIKSLNLQAEENRKTAIKDFEAEIFL